MVSVIIPSYNHEKFVEKCIQSVLNQTFQDFEIIITDDASTDRTVEIIEQFSDPRIKLFKHSTNQGVSITANNCITHANGIYIAWLSTDDIWYPEKLEVQVQYLNEHPEVGVVFGKVDWIDESGNLITDPSFPYLNIFNVHNRTRVEWLRYFFLIGNCLSLPCSLVRKECFGTIGMFDPAYAKIPDLDLWIRICFKYDIAILDQKLIQNRWISDERNASGGTIKNRTQVELEHKHSLDHYLKIRNVDEFLAVFPDSVKYGEVATDLIPYFLGRVAIESSANYKILWGLDTIYALLRDENNTQILKSKCNFVYLDFIKLSNECDTFNLQTIGQLAERLAEREQIFTVQLAEKERAIEILTTQIEARQQEIQNLTAQLHEIKREIEGIKNSRSWRYTLFFRRLSEILHRNTGISKV
ncbi:MAG TPA: glycosyltransferase [Chitinophagaceae bacterium]|nr:glycosyltransferase [Chitinophagaceae bacterium]